MTTRIIKAFEKEVNLTEEGLVVLVSEKKSLVIEFNTKSGMTIARKERTERNKLIESVKRVSIDTENAIKAKRASIIEDITSAYNCIVEPFEAEELRLKQEKERLAKLEEERVESIRKEISAIRNWSLNLFGKSSQELSDIIEAVDMIDIQESFAEFTQEAMQIKRETLTELNVTLSGAIQKEKLAEEQAELEAEKKKVADDKAEFEAWKASQKKEDQDVELADAIESSIAKEETPISKVTTKSLVASPQDRELEISDWLYKNVPNLNVEQANFIAHNFVIQSIPYVFLGEF